MPPTPNAPDVTYRDVLWDVSLASSPRRGAGDVIVRVFHSNAEFYAAGESGDVGSDRSAAPGLSMTLPPMLAAATPSSRHSAAWWTQTLPSAASVTDVGRALWNALPSQARETLPPSAALPVPSPTPVDGRRLIRLKISSTVAALDEIPWEWLDDGTGPLALRDDVCFVRAVPVRVVPPPLVVAPPVRVLLVVTNPKDERVLRANDELSAVQGRLLGPGYQLRVLQEATVRALRQELEDTSPHVVHYIGHAGVSRGDGNIILHQPAYASNVPDASESDWVSPRQLAELLPVSVRLLCLSTCVTAPNFDITGLSRFAHAPAAYQLPTVVANQYPVDLAGVRVFWDAFYDALLAHGGDVNLAMRAGQAAAHAERPTSADWASFTLVLRDGSGRAMSINRPGATPVRTTAGVAFTPEEAAADLVTSDQFAAALQAQFASRLANDLAEQVRTLGQHASGSMREHLERESARAAQLTKLSGFGE